MNGLVVLKLQYIIILLTRRRQYKTKKLNKNPAKKFHSAVCRCSETRSLNSLILLYRGGNGTRDICMVCTKLHEVVYGKIINHIHCFVQERFVYFIFYVPLSNYSFPLLIARELVKTCDDLSLIEALVIIVVNLLLSSRFRSVQKLQRIVFILIAKP